MFRGPQRAGTARSSMVSSAPAPRRVFRLAATTALLTLGLSSLVATAVPSAPAYASATGGNFVATGHDMDFHCANYDSNECAYLTILLDKVRNGSPLPVLALDQGLEIDTALGYMGYAAGQVVTVDPTAASFSTTPFVDGAGQPLYSAIITASDSTCGGCDNDDVGELAISGRAADFRTYFNAGGGIFAMSGADRFATYYNFVPLPGVTGQAVTEPFAPTAAGSAMGITSDMANCCPTHNSFSVPPAPFVVLETDGAGIPETIAAFNALIDDGGFTPADAVPTSTKANAALLRTAGPKVYLKLTAVLTKATTGAAIAGKPVNFYDPAGTYLCGGFTDGAGFAFCKIGVGLIKTVTGNGYRGTFPGDAAYARSSGVAKLFTP